MSQETTKNIRLGIFVVAALLVLIFSLYMIGNKRSLFNPTIKITARFHSVNGLLEGNNVRFNGIDVGTVSGIAVVSDTLLEVELHIEKSAARFINANSVASIGTDGLMGNKLVNISPGKTEGGPIYEGSALVTRKPIDLDEAMRTLSSTNDNLQDITGDVKTITQRFSARNTLWSILLDSTLATDLKQSVHNIRGAALSTSRVAQSLDHLTSNVRSGKGTLGLLLSDTALAGNIKNAVNNLDTSSTYARQITGDLREVSSDLKNGTGSIGMLLHDTAFAHNLNQATISVNKGATGFSENMEALKHNVLFRKYFKKKNKEK